MPLSFLVSLPSSIKMLYIFALNFTNFVEIFPSNSSFVNQITFLFSPLGNGLLDSQFEVSNLVLTSFARSL